MVTRPARGFTRSLPGDARLTRDRSTHGAEPPGGHCSTGCERRDGRSPARSMGALVVVDVRSRDSRLGDAVNPAEARRTRGRNSRLPEPDVARDASLLEGEEPLSVTLLGILVDDFEGRKRVVRTWSPELHRRTVGLRQGRRRPREGQHPRRQVIGGQVARHLLVEVASEQLAQYRSNPPTAQIGHGLPVARQIAQEAVCQLAEPFVPQYRSAAGGIVPDLEILAEAL